MPPKARKPKYQCRLMCCTLPEGAAERIAETLAVWKAGGWAEERNYGPACHCGLRGAKEPCTRHGELARDPGGT